MINDRWDIVHIAIAVPDLEKAMEEYSRGLGIEWGPVSNVELPGVDVEPSGYDFSGSRATVAKPSTRGGGIAVAPLELVEAKPGTPGYAVYGCPDGRDYLHHIAYWVDDIEAESQHLIDEGFEREMVARKDGKMLLAYHLTNSSIRLELYPAASKR